MIFVLSRDLLIASRILAQAEAAGIQARAIAHPSELPAPSEVRVLFVNWSERDATWARLLGAWRARAPGSGQARVVLFGPHTDLDAHAAARSAGLGPMMARSKLISTLPDLVK